METGNLKLIHCLYALATLFINTQRLTKIFLSSLKGLVVFYHYTYLYFLLQRRYGCVDLFSAGRNWSRARRRERDIQARLDL